MNAETIPNAYELPASARQALIDRAYVSPPRESLSEKQILENLPLVKHIAQKIAAHFPGRMDLEELISVGTLGLVRAARSFDPSHEAEFRTYAYIRIRGAIIDHLRAESFVPSGIHRQVRLVSDAYRKLCDRLGHAPADEELAAELGIPLPQLYRTLEEARKQHFLSIHGLAEENDEARLMPVDGGESPSSQMERKEMVEQLAAAIKALPARDRQIILLYYERDLTMKEIGMVLHVAESRVSQLHASALFKLSMKLRRPS